MNYTYTYNYIERILNVKFNIIVHAGIIKLYVTWQCNHRVCKVCLSCQSDSLTSSRGLHEDMDNIGCQSPSLSQWPLVYFCTGKCYLALPDCQGSFTMTSYTICCDLEDGKSFANEQSGKCVNCPTG